MLFDSLQKLAAVGPTRLKLLKHLLGGGRVIDLILHAPSCIQVNHRVDKIVQAKAGQRVGFVAKVVDYDFPIQRNHPAKVHVNDGDTGLNIVLFNQPKAALKSRFPLQREIAVGGVVERYHGTWQMAHPEFVGPPVSLDRYIGKLPVYPLTQGITQSLLRNLISECLVSLDEVDDWLPTELCQDHGWKSFTETIKQLHAPQSMAELEPNSKIISRLAFDEILSQQLSLRLISQQNWVSGQALVGDGKLSAKLQASLPYSLTGDQQLALKEIYADMAAEQQMRRLVQGDVGCGKTLVALFAMIRAVEAGKQAALLAPTDILAQQHYQTLRNNCDKVNIRLGLLTGTVKGSKRKEVLAGLADGSIDIIVGTHAIFQTKVDIAKLGIVVIDEQHRFGVEQRLKLASKGNKPDMLMMSATPIPRTLVMASRGDVELTIIKQKPAGRQPIDTRVLSLKRIDEVVRAMDRALKAGRKIYWICPLVEESEKLDLAAAVDRYKHLQGIFGEHVGLVHGKMSAAEKDAVMHDFLHNKTNILIATTVIEVGVDVPEASIMVVEHAERFGLTQLHQLRGRIGRGDVASTCLLLYAPSAGDTAKQRLMIARESNDGFYLAEADLRIRGGGDVLGTRQSGLPPFRFLDWDVHAALVDIACNMARQILDNDPGLALPEHRSMLTLLNIFRRDEAIKYIRS